VRRKRAHDVLSRHAQPVTGTEGPAPLASPSLDLMTATAAAGNFFHIARTGQQDARDQLRVLVEQCHAAGMSDETISRLAGVRRETIRVWLGRGQHN